MIEIILRKDIQEYEAKPIFGFTYRQAATGALIVAVSAALGIGLSSVGVTGTPLMLAVLAAGGAIGFVGLGRVHGLKPELWYKIRKEDRSWPKTALFSTPALSCASDRLSRKPRPSRREKRQAKTDRAEAASESELLPGADY